MSLPTDVNEARPIVECAIENGINYFDTADLYNKGINEEILGKLLKPHRKDVFIATKVGNQWTPGEDSWTWNPSPSHIVNGLKMSLRRLQTDYVDVYQLHGGTIDDPWDDIIETFEQLKKEGLIREYGISSIRPNVFKPFLENSNAVSNMMQYSILDRRPEEWFNNIVNSNASIVTRGSIAKGLLTSEWKKRIEQQTDYLNYSKDELTQILHQLETTYEDLHALAFAFNLRVPVVSSMVIGARTKEQLEENLKAYKKSKSIQDVSFVDELTKKEKYTAHR